MEIIHKFIRANGKMMTSEKLIPLYKVYIIFSVLILCLLAFAGGIVGISGMIIIPFYCIAGCTYNHYTVRTTSAFKSIFIGYLLLLIYLLLAFNLLLYGILKLMAFNLDIIVLPIIVLEVICMALGCCFSYLSIRNNKIKEYKESTPLTAIIISLLSGCWTIFVRIFAARTPIIIQAFAFSLPISIGCCLFAFYIGKVYIPMLYFIKKYNINEIQFTDEQENK